MLLCITWLRLNCILCHTKWQIATCRFFLTKPKQSYSNLTWHSHHGGMVPQRTPNTLSWPVRSHLHFTTVLLAILVRKDHVKSFPTQLLFTISYLSRFLQLDRWLFHTNPATVDVPVAPSKFPGHQHKLLHRSHPHGPAMPPQRGWPTPPAPHEGAFLRHPKTPQGHTIIRSLPRLVGIVLPADWSSNQVFTIACCRCSTINYLIIGNPITSVQTNRGSVCKICWLCFKAPALRLFLCQYRLWDHWH